MNILFASVFVCSVIAVDLPPCPDDPVCPALPDNRWYTPYNNYDDTDAALQYIDQYDCSNLNLKKRGLSCFGTLPKVLNAAQKQVIIEHGKSLGYEIQFLNTASDDRLKAINLEFDKYNKYLKKNFKVGSQDRITFTGYYRAIHNSGVDDDYSTLDFEPLRDRALAKIQIGAKLSQDLNGLVGINPFFIVPELLLQQMGQVGSQLLKQQPFPRLFFLNTVPSRKFYFSLLMNNALNYVERALTKLKNGHPCSFLPCSDPKCLPAIIRMFEKVLNHPKFILFERPAARLNIQGISTLKLREKGIMGLFESLFKGPYEIQMITFIHETTHFYGTLDFAYGKEKCMALLKDKPQDALNNADSFAFEIIEMGRTSCNIQSPLPFQ